MSDQRNFVVEEVEAGTPVPRARVDQAGADRVGVDRGGEAPRERDYLSGFLAQAPVALAGTEPGGALYEAVIDALKDIFDPEIPVNIYDLGLIYGVDVSDGGHASVTMTLTTPNCPVAESMPGEVELRVSLGPRHRHRRGDPRLGSRPGIPPR